MYNDYFGLSESPFNLTPDSSFFFASEKHKAALDALIYAVKERKGFVVITGEVGAGKTTVARTLLRKLGEQVQTAVITNTNITPKGIISMILEDLGIEYVEGTKERLLVQLYNYLVEQARKHKDVILLIDESQNLTLKCLEEVRMISNLETEKEKLIQIIMLGQPELKKKLASPKLEQLRQRISVQYHLQALNEDETRTYIQHRIWHACKEGSNVDDLFPPATLELIYRYTRGVPRIVNKLCDYALLTAFVSDSKQVTPPLLAEAAQDFYFREENQNEQIYQSA